MWALSVYLGAERGNSTNHTRSRKEVWRGSREIGTARRDHAWLQDAGAGRFGGRPNARADGLGLSDSKVHADQRKGRDGIGKAELCRKRAMPSLRRSRYRVLRMGFVQAKVPLYAAGRAGSLESLVSIICAIVIVIIRENRKNGCALFIASNFAIERTKANPNLLTS